MTITVGPKYRYRCPASEGVTVGKYTGKTYCRECRTPVQLRKNGQPRAHYEILTRVHITGTGLPGF